MVDNRWNFVVRADLEKLWLKLLTFAQIYRLDVVFEL